MTALPVDKSPLLQKAVEITKGLNNGVPMIKNPLATSFRPTMGVINAASARTTDPIVLGALSDLGAQVASLSTHTNRLVFGDSSGLPTRGGITRNIGQALAAIDLNDTLNASESVQALRVDPCALIQEFLGRILGAGAALLGAIQSLIRPILEFVGDLTLALQQIIGQIGVLAAQLLSLIANEIARFVEWLAKQINFGLARFLAALGLPRNLCAAGTLGAVATPALLDILGP